MYYNMEYFKANRAVLEHALFEDESNPSIILPMPNKIASNATGEYLVATAGNYDIIKKRSVLHNHLLINHDIMSYMVDFNVIERAMIVYISKTIRYQSNVVPLSPEILAGRLNRIKVYPREFYPAIAHLTNLNIINRIEYNGLYCVNPLYIFKGSIERFIEVYDTYIGGTEQVSVNGRIMCNTFVIGRKVGKDYHYSVYKNKDSALKKIKINKAQFKAEEEPIDVTPKPVSKPVIRDNNGKKIKFNFRKIDK